ncbi:MAG: A24 family peptidase [Candidatus Pacearchaeota archaeon]|nr:A24 family peptidase [Candidatus Pacearchaeota archaeon]
MADLIFISDVFLSALALVLLLAASVTDLKKREVPNWLSFSCIGVASAIRAIASVLSGQPLYFLYAIFSFLIFFILANLFYYTRIFGGGDAKLLMALSVLFATNPMFLPITQTFLISQSIQTPLSQIISTEPLLLTFLINSFFLGAIYGLGFSIFSVIKNRNVFWKQFKKENKKIGLFRTLFWLAGLILLTMSFFSSEWFVLIAITLFLIPYLYLFIKTAESVSMIKRLNPSELTEGDWIIQPIKVKGKAIMPSIHGLNKEEIALLRKTKKPVMVKYGLPFVPVFFISLVCAFFFGDLLFIVLHFRFGI